MFGMPRKPGCHAHGRVVRQPAEEGRGTRRPSRRTNAPPRSEIDQWNVLGTAINTVTPPPLKRLKNAGPSPNQDRDCRWVRRRWPPGLPAISHARFPPADVNQADSSSGPTPFPGRASRPDRAPRGRACRFRAGSAAMMRGMGDIVRGTGRFRAAACDHGKTTTIGAAKNRMPRGLMRRYSDGPTQTWPGWVARSGAISFKTLLCTQNRNVR